jgi:hypothetical protein
VVYSGADVRISLKVGEPGSKLDLDAFLGALVTRGLIQMAPLQRLVAKHTHDTAARHEFSSTIL